MPSYAGLSVVGSYPESLKIIRDGVEERCDTEPAMEHQHEPGSIGDKMLKIAETCAATQRAKAKQLHHDAATEKAQGDSFYKVGEWDRAAGAHGQAMRKEAIAKACEEAADDIEQSFGLEGHPEPEKGHRGVGEGDAGLPANPTHPEHAENLLDIFEIDELPLEQLSRKQFEHLAIGIERATDWILCAPQAGDWFWALQDEAGERLALSGLTTARETFTKAMTFSTVAETICS